LQQALAQHRLWTARGFKVPRIAVNVSAIQLQRKEFADIVMTVLHEEGDNPEALELEITESLIMRDVENSRRKFQVLRGLGIQIGMDDFGTGYSALAVLARLPIDTLKIDRSFVIGMTENPQDFGIVMTIINLAHSLNLRVVAEGVETQEQATLLKLLKCDEAQGFLFSRPVPPAEIEDLLLSAAPALQFRREAEA
jgi:EAL domain-containing protein (putative c-di-GMP-specific phosphodiesterase class I)